MTTNGSTDAASLDATLGAPVIAARSLSAGYGDTVVVHEIDLVVHPGEIVALLGPNGSGRTTSLLTLCGELPSKKGTVLWRGRPVSSPMHLRVREGLGVVTEDRSVFRRLTVADNLRVSKADLDVALTIFPELREHLRRRVGLLSGGQQQMVALARALGRRPSVLLIDELSLGLAPLLVDRLLLAIREAADGGVAVLVVEQHIRKILAVADRAYVMRRGRIVMSGDTAQLRHRVGEVQASYL